MMTALKWTVLIGLLGYGGLAALLYVAQRAMMYFPETERVAPARAGFPQAEELMLTSVDGERLVAWHLAPREGRPVVVYFHGNGGNLSHRVPRFRALADHGLGLLALSYRGYGGSSGRPSETGLFADGAAAYDEAARRYPVGRLIVWGESLGTGVAIAVAAERAVKGLVLEAPFASTVEIAAAANPIFPVRWLMKDQYRSDLRIGAVRAPILIMHGTRDGIVPIASGERLFALASEPKKFIRFPGGDHNDLDDHGASTAALAFIDALP